MFVRKLMIILCAASASAVLAQRPAPPPQPAPAATAPSTGPDGGEPHYIKAETPEQRKQRLGTAEDPGTNPDPSKSYWRFGRNFHIDKFERRWANFDDAEPGYVLPFAFLNVQKEIYQVNDKWVWVWMPEATDEEISAAATPKVTSPYPDKTVAYFKKMRPEFFETSPKQSDVTVHFEESSDGLPTSGSWRNSGAVADMNGDGCPDIIAPPERAGGNVPAIFLGDCRGHWKYWADVKWPRSVDYGSVVAADFNHDGHMDLAFGVHLTGVYIFLGDGKGHFTEVTKGVPITGYPTRRVMVADVDGDGWPDVVAIGEGPTSPREHTDASVTRLRVLLNRDKGQRWESIDAAPTNASVAGDWLSIGNFNGDKTPDFVTASVYYGGSSNLLLSTGPRQWKPSYTEGEVMPGMGYYFASAAGKFSSKTRDDAIVSYIRFWPNDLPEQVVPAPPTSTIVGLDRISFTGKEPKRTPVMRWAGGTAVWGMGAGDFDHDGNLDVMFTRFDPREAVLLLGDGKGGFTRAKVEGLTLPPNTNYDLLVADVNNDGLPDVILMYESAAKTVGGRNGSIRVFLNKGVTRGPAPAK